jgi:GNAT superfamily N-acetyltransferase
VRDRRGVEKVDVRLAIRRDLPALLELYRQLGTEQPLELGPEAEAVWSRILDQPGVFAYVADVDGVVAGTVTLVVVPNLTWSGRPYSLIENVVTLDSYRRRGIGSALMKHAMAEAARMGCFKVMLFTGSRRESTHAFYRGVGLDPGSKTAYVRYLVERAAVASDPRGDGESGAPSA